MAPLHLRAEADNAGKSYRDLEHLFVLANLEFTLLHEFGHALIDDLQLPVFGMEEDAADRIAIIAMLGVRRFEPEQQMIPWLLAVASSLAQRSARCACLYSYSQFTARSKGRNRVSIRSSNTSGLLPYTRQTTL